MKNDAKRLLPIIFTHALKHSANMKDDFKW